MTMPVASQDMPLLPGDQRLAAGARQLPGLSKLLHWVTAFLVLLMFVSGVLMKQLSGGPASDALYTLHKTTGATLLALVLLRLGYRLWAHLTGRWRSGSGSHAVHAGLYLGLIMVPLLGWAGVSDFGARGIYLGYSLPRIWPEGAGHFGWLFLAHAWLAFIMLALVVVHLGLALNDYIQRGAQRMPH
jgi:cytochrome b561